MPDDTLTSFENPLGIVNYDAREMVSNGRLGAIVARTGSGKTAFIVQVAIDTILQGKKVLHVSLGESVNKVNIWYKEVLNNLTSQYDLNQIDSLRELVQDRRFIMTFNAEKFNFEVLQRKVERLNKERFFQPTVVIIDGLFFDDSVIQSLKELRIYSQKKKLHIWFTVTVHRDDTSVEYDKFSTKLDDYFHSFDAVIKLRSRDGKVFMEFKKGELFNNKKQEYVLDASTMLVKKFMDRK